MFGPGPVDDHDLTQIDSYQDPFRGHPAHGFGRPESSYNRPPGFFQFDFEERGKRGENENLSSDSKEELRNDATNTFAFEYVNLFTERHPDR